VKEFREDFAGGIELSFHFAAEEPHWLLVQPPTPGFSGGAHSAW
jgi:hypothetical protein